MTLAQGSADIAFPGMMPPAVQKGAAQSAVGTAVLAASAFLANWEQQPVTQGNAEVPIWHGWHAFLGGKQERAGPRTPMGPEVGSIFVREVPQQSFPFARADLLAPDALKTASAFSEPPGPIQGLPTVAASYPQVPLRLPEVGPQGWAP